VGKSLADCSGYKASNIERVDGWLRADLTLVGDGCGVYGKDLVDLKFFANWQTGMIVPLPVVMRTSGDLGRIWWYAEG
jgi:hypothetical protein